MTRPPNPDLTRDIQRIVSEEIHRQGVEGLTMRHIAEQAGITPTTLYYYFKNKQHLLDTIRLNAVREMDEYILGGLQSEDPPATQLCDLIRSFVQWTLENPRVMELVFERLPPKIEPDEDLLRDYYRSQVKAIELIDRGIQAGHFSSRDPRLDASVFLGMLYGTLKLFLDKRVFPEYWNDFTPIVNRIIQIMMDALRPAECSENEGEN